LSVDFVKRYIAEYNLLAVAFIIIGSGALVLVEWPGEDLPVYLFYIGAALIWSIGSPFTQTIIISSFSKILGSKPQGIMMGWIGSAGSVGRIIFPLLAGILGSNGSFVIAGALSFFCGASVLGYRRYVTYVKKYLDTPLKPINS